jgi:galactose mutarotase-like enzyme
MSNSWLLLGMITISFSGRPEAASHGLAHICVNRAADAFPKCTRPNQDFSSITAIILTGRCADREVRFYSRHTGFAFDMQHFSDSPNQPAFPCTVLCPGERFASTTEYRFRID